MGWRTWAYWLGKLVAYEVLNMGKWEKHVATSDQILEEKRKLIAMAVLATSICIEQATCNERIQT